MIVQISAGQGPAECQLAAAKLFEALKKEYGDLEIISSTKGSERGCLDSVRFRTEHDLSGLEGTVLWICKSPFRRNHKRKNWYVDVSIIPDRTEIASDREYRIEKFHCGGKGGQNVNKVETGVRVIHIPTGLTAQSTEERSQLRNKQRAMEKLQERLGAAAGGGADKRRVAGAQPYCQGKSGAGLRGRGVYCFKYEMIWSLTVS